MTDSTTPAGTPAAGRPFTGLRRRLAAAIDGRVICDECASAYDASEDRCPACAQRRRRRAGLETVIDTYAGDRPWMTIPDDGAAGPETGAGDGPEGWPW
jgi:hypothetical protein